MQAASQFEDTRVFGPASAFAFTLEEGQGMLRADPPIGDWHMRCHVGPSHDGGVGSLLVVNGGELALPPPVGKAPPRPPGEREPAPPPPRTHDVRITDGVENHFTPSDVNITQGDIVRWTNTGGATHSVTANPPLYWSSGDIPPGQSWSLRFYSKGYVSYRCDHHRKVGNWTIALTNDCVMWTRNRPSGAISYARLVERAVSVAVRTRTSRCRPAGVACRAACRPGSS